MIKKKWTSNSIIKKRINMNKLWTMIIKPVLRYQTVFKGFFFIETFEYFQKGSNEYDCEYDCGNTALVHFLCGFSSQNNITKGLVSRRSSYG